MMSHLDKFSYYVDFNFACGVSYWLLRSMLESPSMETVSDHSPVVYFTVAISFMALHYGVLRFVQGDIIVLIPISFLAIIMKVLPFLLCICCMPGHVIRAKESYVDAFLDCPYYFFSAFQKCGHLWL